MSKPAHSARDLPQGVAGLSYLLGKSSNCMNPKLNPHPRSPHRRGNLTGPIPMARTPRSNGRGTGSYLRRSRSGSGCMVRILMDPPKRLRLRALAQDANLLTIGLPGTAGSLPGGRDRLYVCATREEMEGVAIRLSLGFPTAAFLLVGHGPRSMRRARLFAEVLSELDRDAKVTIVSSGTLHRAG